MDLDLKKRIDDLSFGNKKKVGIVQGLLHEHKLIILDEPTSGLDPLMQQKFFDLLLEENKAALANVVILNIVTLVFSISIVSKYSKGEAIAGDIQILMVGMFILQLLYL